HIPFSPRVRRDDGGGWRWQPDRLLVDARDDARTGSRCLRRDQSRDHSIGAWRRLRTRAPGCPRQCYCSEHRRDGADRTDQRAARHLPNLCRAYDAWTMEHAARGRGRDRVSRVRRGELCHRRGARRRWRLDCDRRAANGPDEDTIKYIIAWAAMVRPLFALLLFVLLSPAHAADPAKVLRIASPDIDTLDPQNFSDDPSFQIIQALFEPAYEWDYLASPPKLTPLTAEGPPEITDNEKTWTIHLKHGIYFID